MRFEIVLATLLVPFMANAQVRGKLYGFATGVTGGGSGTPAASADVNH